jgi:hypothetical protein
MEKLTAVVLNSRYGNIIAAESDVCIPFGWTAIVSGMLQRIHDLPTATRARLIVTALRVDDHGLLEVDIAAVLELMADGAIRDIEAIVRDARNHAAWSCVRDGKAAWIVRPPKGLPRPLCPECQRDLNMSAEFNCA